jgi:hypothetical protein
LNGREFRWLDHLNEMTARWLAEVADVRVHRETKRRPIDLHAEEQPYLIPLPDKPYDTAEVVYRAVNAEGMVAYRQNFYSVPWQYLGQVLPLPQCLRRYSNYELLIIDEFGFDRVERAESAQAASLLYKVVDSRVPKRSTTLVTNISFEAWADYLDDAPLAMAILDRLVDGAIVLKIEGRSYRAHRTPQQATPASAEIPKSQRRRKATG